MGLEPLLRGNMKNYSQIRKWHKNGKFIHLCLGVLTCGFVTSVRPSHAIVFLIPILYGVFSWTTFVEKIKLIISLKSKLILVIIIFLVLNYVSFFLQIN